jgi:hypothetical protein
MSEGRVWTHEIMLATEPDSVARARDFVCRHLLAHDLGYLVEDVRRAAGEMAADATAHAGSPFVVVLEARGRSVLLTVDADSPLVPAPRVARQCGVDPRPSGGRSVWASFDVRSPADSGHLW